VGSQGWNCISLRLLEGTVEGTRTKKDNLSGWYVRNSMIVVIVLVAPICCWCVGTEVEGIVEFWKEL
jgi:hypothetical protein